MRCFALVLGLGALVLCAGAAAAIDLGVVGKVKSVSEDGKSFEVASKAVKKTLVFDDKETEFKKVDAKPFGMFKEGDRIHVLGKKTEGNERVEAAINGIISIASGEFDSPDLPEKQKGVKGLEWISGTLEKDGKRLKLSGAILTTGGKRPVAVFSDCKRHEVIKKKNSVFVRGRFRKKEKGEKFHRIMAESVFLVGKGISAREHAFLFDMSQKKK